MYISYICRHIHAIHVMHTETACSGTPYTHTHTHTHTHTNTLQYLPQYYTHTNKNETNKRKVFTVQGEKTGKKTEQKKSLER